MAHWLDEARIQMHWDTRQRVKYLEKEGIRFPRLKSRTAKQCVSRCKSVFCD